MFAVMVIEEVLMSDGMGGRTCARKEPLEHARVVKQSRFNDTVEGAADDFAAAAAAAAAALAAEVEVKPKQCDLCRGKQC